MTPKQAGRMADAGRRLRKARLITTHCYNVLDVLLFSFRRPMHDGLIATYDAIALYAGCKRDTAMAAIKRLGELGLLVRIRRRVPVAWGVARGCVASRQAANAYRFIVRPDTESAAPTALREIERIPSSTATAVPAESPLGVALASLGAAIEARECRAR